MSIRGAAARGAAILSVVNIVVYVVSFSSLLVLARLLTPRDFGEVALVLAIADFSLLLAAWSLSTALIREPEATVQEAFDTSIILMFGISAAVLTAAAAIVVPLWIVGTPTLAQMLAAVMVARLATLFGGCYSAELERRFAYMRVAAIQGLAVTGSVGAALALAVAGAGVWALAARDIVASLIVFVLSVRFSRWRPRWAFSATKARELLAFGTRMIGSRLGEMLFHRYDNLVVGLVAGTRQLGFYSQAYLLAESGNRIYGPVLQQVPLATYARLQDAKALTARAFEIVSFFLARGVVPLATVFVIAPRELLSVLLGHEWAPAAGVLRLLVGYVLLLPLFDQMRVLLVANGAVSDVLRARLVQLAFFIPATAVGTVLWGNRGAALAVSTGMVVGIVAIVRSARRYAPAVGANTIAPCLAGIAAGVVALAVTRDSGGDVAFLVRAGAAVFVVYLASLVLLERRTLTRHVTLLWRSLHERDAIQIDLGLGITPHRGQP